MGKWGEILPASFFRIGEFMEKFTVKYALKNFEEIIASALFCVTLLLVMLNVITRYVFRTGIPWSEEFATGCFVWTAFVGSAACYKSRTHVGVDVLVNKFPLSAQNVVKIIIDILMAVLCTVLFALSIKYIIRSARKPTAILGISSAYVTASLVVSFFDMAVWSFIFIFRDLKSIKKFGRVVSQEEYEELKKEGNF